jgi:hypothetical protein
MLGRAAALPSSKGASPLLSATPGNRCLKHPNRCQNLYATVFYIRQFYKDEKYYLPLSFKWPWCFFVSISVYITLYFVFGFHIVVATFWIGLVSSLGFGRIFFCGYFRCSAYIRYFFYAFSFILVSIRLLQRSD